MKANILELQRSNKDKRFIPLGQITSGPLDNIIQKLLKKTPPSDVWGTLGWESNEPFTPNGDIQFSETGNYNEGNSSVADRRRKDNKLTKQEVLMLKEMHPDLKITAKGVVQERFINFDDVDFKLPASFKIDQIKSLRLSLFLSHDEGAVVYYQHSKRGEYNDEEAISEYIYSVNDADDTQRDYLFPIIPKYEWISDKPELGTYKESTTLSNNSFIVKILVFKKKKRAQAKRLEEIAESLSSNNKKVGVHKYQLLLFNAEKNSKCISCTKQEKKRDRKKLHKELAKSFDVVLSKGQICPKKKTLLLLHGTFVDTMASFEDLIVKEPGKESTLERLLKNTEIEQIIALDHPTVLADAEMNAEWFKKKLAAIKLKFEKPLSILTSSRGGMLGEYMVVSDKLKAHIPSIDKVLMFSPGNGCGYFEMAQSFAKGANAMRVVTPGSSEFLLSLTQFSVKAILELPGFKMMTKGSPAYDYILNNDKCAYPEAQFITAVSDWDKSLVPSSKVMKRALSSGLDLFIKIPLGDEHDWVIGVNAQVLCPKPFKNKLSFRYSVHGKYLNANHVLTYPDKKQFHPHQIIFDTFNQ